MKQNLKIIQTKILKITLILAVIASLAIALAHATIVIVTLNVDPLTPQVNEAMQFSIFLETPLQVPVEDAILIVEAKPKDGVTTQITRIELIEDAQSPGTYRGEITPTKEGPWDFFFRDQTYKAEEATNHVEILVGEENFSDIEFIFPPTAIQSSNSWRTWLIWLVGLPLVAAIILTVFVLTKSPEETKSIS